MTGITQAGSPQAGILKVQFLFDFGSPNAFLCHRVLPEIAVATGIRIDYVPVLLGGIFKATGNQSPSTAFGHIRNKPAYEQLEIARFARRHGIGDFTFNPHFPVNTLNLMRGAIAAGRIGVFDAYVDAVFGWMWAEPRKMDDPAVAAEALAASGLDGAAIMTLAQSPEVKAELVANTEDGVARGAFGVPTFFVDDEMWFGKDRLRDVAEAITVATKKAAR